LSFGLFETPIDIIAEFIKEMEELSGFDVDERIRLIFIIAKEVATDILCLFL
jgi:hypothetical protein